MSVPSHNGARRVSAEPAPKVRATSTNRPVGPADHVRIKITDRDGNVRGSATLTWRAAVELSNEIQAAQAEAHTNESEAR